MERFGQIVGQAGGCGAGGIRLSSTVVEMAGPRRGAVALPSSSWLGLLTLLLVVVGFAVWSVNLVVRAGELRGLVEANVARLQRTAALRQATAAWLAAPAAVAPAPWVRAADEVVAVVAGADDAGGAIAGGLAALERARVAASPEALGELQRALDGLSEQVRRDNAERSAALGAAWEDLSFVVFTTLVMAGLVVALSGLAELRRLHALRLAGEIAATAEALAETRAALRAQEAMARVADELRVARDRAEEASAAKSRFMATMSHELLTPLNIILGYAALLRERCEEAPLAELGGDVGRLESAGHGLYRLLRHVLDLSDLDSGALVFAREELRLAELLGRAIEELRPAVERGGGTITLAAPAELRIVGDRGRLTTVIAEVLDNACRFAAGGQVSVRAEAEADGVRIEVRDDGPGMGPEACAQATVAFYQADGSRTRAHDGAGLGLTVAARLSARMGGALALRSAPGAGTTVEIRVPWRPPAGA